ncbi:DUF2973 domain-containing protein [Myxacorys almedinensis A]|uniref:DUF2973 domain-containing protein n=1 Tax=Myxacorys almedinensis A TaxID=2690445 RepID=A0A8J7Z763_9CYAN|nr:DUF2973 domain-containing protein [Myxacorys almedinensis A]
MLHLLYILAFTILAFLAVGNLIRNLLTLGIESHRQYPSNRGGHASTMRSVPHPELLDSEGRMVNEPLLVMKSMTVEDAREQLDALYNSSPGSDPFREDA